MLYLCFYNGFLQLLTTKNMFQPVPQFGDTAILEGYPAPFLEVLPFLISSTGVVIFPGVPSLEVDWPRFINGSQLLSLFFACSGGGITINTILLLVLLCW